MTKAPAIQKIVRKAASQNSTLAAIHCTCCKPLEEEEDENQANGGGRTSDCPAKVTSASGVRFTISISAKCG